MTALRSLRIQATRRDAVAPLLAASDPALTWAVQHDLFRQELDPRSLWNLPRVVRAERSQNQDGSWTYHGGATHLRSREDYRQLATYQQMLTLISIYRLDRRHPMIVKAAERLLQFQKPGGDIRGIYGSQYTPNYTADILRLLIEAGYTEDPRVLKGLEWLLAVRQDDGGWAIPLRTSSDYAFTQVMQLRRPLEPNRTKPSSHLITGIVLRALAAHPMYRKRPEARQAGLLLASRFFQDDAYVDRRDAAYWTKLSFPFRWTDLVSALDSIALVGIEPDQPDVEAGLRWLVDNQLPSGLWRAGYGKSPNPLLHHWVSFAAMRVFRRWDLAHISGTWHIYKDARAEFNPRESDLASHRSGAGRARRP